MSHSFVPAAASSARVVKPSLILQIALTGLGVLSLSALAQITIPLPWTPVPITGQTFGVAALALLFGRKLAVTTVLAYLGVSALGAPVLAGASAFTLGASAGYLAGMLVAAFVVGQLADRGWAGTWLRAFASAYVSSLCIFAGGLLVLNYFVPRGELLHAGLWPFLFGDFVKNVAAATVARGAQHLRAH